MRFPAALLGLLLVACDTSSPAVSANRAQTAAPAPAWRSAPREGVELTSGDTLLIRTGPHAVLWPAGAPSLTPPYSIRATLDKRTGRLHEGFGLVFGGAPLDGAEDAQRYSYFLVRGDGSYLIKRREGSQTPTVRPWTAAAVVRRDAASAGQPNTLRVDVDSSEVRFSVNGQEVANVPAAELRTTGTPGLRVSHDVTVAAWGWRVSR